jgi:hypothetical protein
VDPVVAFTGIGRCDALNFCRKSDHLGGESLGPGRLAAPLNSVSLQKNHLVRVRVDLATFPKHFEEAVTIPSREAVH